MPNSFFPSYPDGSDPCSIAGYATRIFSAAWRPDAERKIARRVKRYLFILPRRINSQRGRQARASESVLKLGSIGDGVATKIKE